MLDFHHPPADPRGLLVGLRLLGFGMAALCALLLVSWICNKRDKY